MLTAVHVCVTVMQDLHVRLLEMRPGVVGSSLQCLS